MTAELARGQNHPLSATRLEIRVAGGHPLLACALGTDERGTAVGDSPARPGAPGLPGVQVPRQAAAVLRCAFDLDALPDTVHRVALVLALPEGPGAPGRFGATAGPHLALAGPGGTALAAFTVTGLDTETALIAVELYRRRGAWKVRAVGQGYAGGLARLLADEGHPRAREAAAEIQRAAAPTAPRAAPARLGTGSSAGAAAPGPAGGPAGPGTPADAVPPAASGSRDRGDTVDAARPPTGGPGDTAGAAAPRTGTPAPPPLAPSAAAPVPSAPIDYAHPGRRSTPPPSPPAAPSAAPVRPSGPVAGDATGWSLEERLYNQVWGMFEDLARSVAAYRGAVDFAESRMDRELDDLLADPRARVGGAADAAREAARDKCERLTAEARAVLDRDLAQLAAESDVVEPALPPSCARWDNPVWHAHRAPRERPLAVRLGDLTLPEAPGLVIPFLVRLPLERGLWVDSGHTGPGAVSGPDRVKRLALDTAVAHAARLLAVHPPGAFSVQVVDPAGTAAAALAPLVSAGVTALPATGAQGVAGTLARLTERVDLITMALRGGAADALPPGPATAGQLLIVNDFPHGFDDRSVTRLRYLADEGPAAGVHLLMVADREDAAAYGPELDRLWRSLLRITPVPDDHLADPWVRHAWTYGPLTVPPGSAVLEQVLDRVMTAGYTGDDEA